MKSSLLLLFIIFTICLGNNERNEELYKGSIILNTYQNLEKQAVISTLTFEQLKTDLFKKLNIKSTEELSKVYYDPENLKQNLGTVSKVLGFFTFVNIIWVVAIFICAISFSWLFGIYIVDWLINIPAIMKEILAWSLSFSIIFIAYRFESHISPFIAFTGCLGIPASFSLSVSLHSKNDGNPKLFVQLLTMISLIVWIPTAIYYDTKLIGFICSIALESLLGFSVAVYPFCYVIGFDSEESLVKAGGASLIMICINVILSYFDKELKYLRPFQSGMLFMGTFVYFLMLLIISNKYFNYSRSFNLYLKTNFIAIVSGVLALFFGSIYPNLGYLQGVGGTFFMLILISKYSEINWSGSRAAWGLFGLGGILYAMALFINSYPQYFIFNF